MSELNGTTTKKELVNRIAADLGVKKYSVKSVIQNFLDRIIEELALGNRLILHGFGSFRVVLRPARIAQSPRTLEKIQVPPKHVVKFKVGLKMRQNVTETTAESAAAKKSTPEATEKKSWMDLLNAMQPSIHEPSMRTESEDSWAEGVSAFEGTIEHLRSGLRFESWTEGRNPKRIGSNAAKGDRVSPWRALRGCRRRRKTEGPCDLFLSDLVYQVALDLGYEDGHWMEGHCFRVIQNFLDCIIDELALGHRLEFREFGVFEVKERAARSAQNPRTLERVQVPAKRVVKFKPGRRMRVWVSHDIDAVGQKTLDGHHGLNPERTSLVITNGQRLESLEAISSLTSLTTLYINDCSSLTSIDGLANLTSLTSVEFDGCSSLTSIDGLANLTSLTSVNLSNCTSLTNIDVLANLTSLTSVDLYGCTSLEDSDASNDGEES